MKYLLILVAVAVVGLGAAGMVYGEGDDSPGWQLIGLVLIIGALVSGVRVARRGR